MPDKPILRADLTDQHIADIGRRIELGAQEVDDLSELFEGDEFPDKRTDVAYRTLVPQRISADDVNSFILHENVAPANRSLKYATFRKKVEDYGTRHEYTSKNIEDNPDSVVSDCVEDLDGWTTDMKKFLALKALKGTHSSVSFATSISNTMDKAYSILSDVLEADPFAGGEYLMIAPGSVRQKLKNDLLSLNNGNSALILPSNEQMKLFKGYVGSWNGFSIMVPKGAAKYLQDATNVYVFFIGRTDKGQNPLRRLKKKGALTEIHHHPLGSGIMKNAAGEIVPDYNHQKGGVGENMKGILYYIRDDRFVLMCTIAKSSLGAVDISAEIPADGDDDGTVVQTIDRVISNHGGTVSDSGGVLTDALVVGPETAKITSVGGSIQLTANHDVVWSIASADAAKATIDEFGKLTMASSVSSDTTVDVKAFDGTTEVTKTVTFDV